MKPLSTEIPAQMRLHAVRTGQQLDRATFLVAVEAAAHELREVEQPGPIVISLTDPISSLVTLFGVWNAGRCAVMINPTIKPEEKRRILAKTGAAVLIDDMGQHKQEPDAKTAPQHPDAALVLMTSGTTGDPKGVMHSHETLQARISANLAQIGEKTCAQTLCTLPLFFGHGLIGNTLTAMFAGGTVHLWPNLQIDELSSFGPTLDRLGITFLSSVPTFWKMILATSPRPGAPPSRVHVGSAPLSHVLWSDIIAWCGTEEVFNTYGMTEAANWISGGRLDGAGGRDGYVGRPWGGRFAIIRDGVRHNSGEGEVILQSPGQMLGLWADPAGTKAAVQDGWLVTGDIGRLDQDQNLWLIGRRKHEINVAGIKVLAEEVDLLLERHPDVAEACAFGLPDPIAGERVAAIVRTTAQHVTPDALISWCRENARADAVPARLEVVTDIPKNDRGKVARKDIQERMLARWS